MSAFYDISSSSVTTDNIILQGGSGIVGESIFYNGVNPVWYKQNKSALFVDSTDGSQDLNTPPVVINFDTQIYNNIDLAFSGNSFTFNVDGIFKINFECLLSNCDAQTVITFVLNGNFIYGIPSTFIPGSNNLVPFYSSYIINVVNGDVLEIYGEKYNNGPNYLKKNPIYGTPCTKLEIISM